MILVTVGSSGTAFDRLLCEVENLDTSEEVLIQHGPSQVRPPNARCVAFLHFNELRDAVRSARIVITHGGVGSVLLALMNGKRPVVVPREHRYGEVVDDHQVLFAERLARDGLVTLVRDPRELRLALDAGHGKDAAPSSNGRSKLEAELADYLRHALNDR